MARPATLPAPASASVASARAGDDGAATTAPAGESAPASPRATAAWPAELLAMTKPRLSLLSVMTAVVGYLAARPEWHFGNFVAMFVGTALAAGGAIALNQWGERASDRLMHRTRQRPMAAGTVPAPLGAVWGVLLCLTGDLVLALGTTPLAGALALATQLTYLGLYTPLKRITPWNTEVGALPGSLPPLLGWAAATGELSPLAWALFAILFCWQMPHFMAIAWTFRADYARAHLRMATVVDPTGERAARHAVAWAVLLVPAAVVPVLLGEARWAYGAVALAASLWFAGLAWRYARPPAQSDRTAAARRLFFASLAYLPFVCGALLVERAFWPT